MLGIVCVIILVVIWYRGFKPRIKAAKKVEGLEDIKDEISDIKIKEEESKYTRILNERKHKLKKREENEL